ncbi:MAG: signal recognition particle protein [Rickettsiales bacterium]|nr:signal recognition particle protein [Rickettsiales bacterium]
MFERLTSNLNKIFENITGVGHLTESDIDKALREIRIALLEADVALPVVKEFTKLVKEKATGEKVTKSISPGQMVIKIVNDCLVEILSSDSPELNLKTSAPAVILMVGLQGSGKTTTTAKLAGKLKKQGKKILLASIDIHRPAAQKQLEVLASQLDIDFFKIPDKSPKVPELSKQILKAAAQYDILLLDTAGRLHIDEELMSELKKVQKFTNPIETLLVVDALTGQDAINIAKNFQDTIPLTGLIITKMDSDTRGGVALSINFLTKCPIKFLGTGEHITNLEEFHADRMASRILDMGDVVSLVEKATEAVDLEKSQSTLQSFQDGNFDLNGLAEQLKSLKKMGGIGSLIKLIPGISKLMSSTQNANIDEKMIDKQLAIISSMTCEERENPRILNASRKKRIAAGSGSSAQEVNKLFKQFLQASKAFKRFKNIDQDKLDNMNITDLFS